MDAKRNLFQELAEGFDALKGEREGQRTLRTVRVEAIPPEPRGAHKAQPRTPSNPDRASPKPQASTAISSSTRS